jgi:hypothetical protein
MSLVDAEYLTCVTLKKNAEEELKKFCQLLKARRVTESCPIYEGEIRSEPRFFGAMDFYDIKKQLSPPSIGWKCSITECYIDADLPIPVDGNNEEFYNALRQIKCGVVEVHEHETVEGEKEDHVHILCKVYPKHLAKTVKILASNTLRTRGSF